MRLAVFCLMHSNEVLYGEAKGFLQPHTMEQLLQHESKQIYFKLLVFAGYDKIPSFVFLNKCVCAVYIKCSIY